jgi:phage terminase large subunit
MEVIKKIKRICNSLGFGVSLNKINTQCNGVLGIAYSISITGNISEIPTKIKRKQAKKTEHRDPTITGVLKVEDVGYGEYAGFSVDGDNLFLLEDNTVTHNSWDAAAHAIRLASSLKLKFLCTRMFQNRIEDSVYTLIADQIDRFGFSKEYTILKNKIINDRTGSEFNFLGLARNIEEVKSYEGIDILWNEESHNLSESTWDILEPTVRKDHSEIWLIFNPRLATDFVYTKFVKNPPHNAIVRKINYDENPFLSEVSKQTIEDMKATDYDKYLHVYEGLPRQDDEDVIIKRSWLDSCIDAHKKLKIDVSGEKVTGYDVADSGEDLNAFVNKHGILVTKIHQWKAKEDELVKSAKIVRNEAVAFGSLVRYDSIGVGAGVGSNIKELDKITNQEVRTEAFNSGGAVVNPNKEYELGVKNKDYFANVKAQMWKLVADRVLLTHNAVTKGLPFDESEIISISSDCDHIEALLTELSTPRKDYDLAGRFKVESKKDLAKRGVKSPNLADAFMMCFAPKEAKFEFSIY